MTTAAEMVEFYTEAEMKVLRGQSVSINGRTMTRADLSEIRDGRHEWERRAAADARAKRGARNGYSLATFGRK